MNLTEICRKYRISDNYLGSKEDGLIIARQSISDLIGEINSYGNTMDRSKQQTIISKLERLSEFMKDVKESGF